MLAFFQEFFSGGGKTYCYANLFCYANFSMFSDQILGGQKSPRGKLPQGARPLPPVEESQHVTKDKFPSSKSKTVSRNNTLNEKLQNVIKSGFLSNNSPTFSSLFHAHCSLQSSLV